MKIFHVLMTATRTVEVKISENDLNDGETFEDAAELLAIENAFVSSDPRTVCDVQGWDVTVEEIKDKTPKTA